MTSDAGTAMPLPRVASQPDEVTDRPTPVQLRALWVPFCLFALISIADTVSSVVMLRNGMMDEANPIMHWVWHWGGATAFVGVKAFLLVGPLALFNAMKVGRYRFIRRVIWTTILGYVLIYGFFFYLGNL
jgi:Domain of unknown function (DUF5658)